MEGLAEGAKTGGSTASNPATLVVSSVVVSPKKSGPCKVCPKSEESSAEWKVVSPAPPAVSKLRPDARKQLYHEMQETGSTTNGHDDLPATAGEVSVPASATSEVQPAARSPQPLSVVAVWARTPSSQREAARNKVSLPPRAGAHFSHVSGSGAAGDCTKLQSRPHSPALRCRKDGRVEGPSTSGAKTGTMSAARIRRRPASAGLLYFRAHLSGNAKAVEAPQRRGGGRAAGSTAGSTRFSTARGSTPLPLPSRNAGGTTPKRVDEARARPEGLLDSMMVTVSRRNVNFLTAEAAAVVGNEGASAPDATATTAMAAIGRKPWFPLPSALTQEAGDSSLPDSRRSLPRNPGAATAATTTDVDFLSPRRAGRPPPAPREASARPVQPPQEAACAERQHRHHHASTLEMISALTQKPPAAPPECVTGLEIPISAMPARSKSSSPGRVRDAAGANLPRVVAGCHGHERRAVFAPSERKSSEANPGGPAPCNVLRKSSSWTGGDKKRAASGGNGRDQAGGRAAILRLLFGKKRDGIVEDDVGGGDERPLEPCLQLYVGDPSESEPRVCGEHAIVCTPTGLVSPGRGGGGEGGGGRTRDGVVVLEGDGQPRKATRFCR